MGDRCLESTRIEIHHIRPLHLGGSDNLENLVTLCQEHHRCLHSKQA
ncbi:MAG: HNH endonuclease [Bdellovibrionales bacterium]|nr:HNH endonuclease [Bdellovibrionales bacterium]